jgi:N-acetylglutamate synthase-like GNAT family acetyltransferase
MRAAVERIYGWDDSQQRERFLERFDPAHRNVIELDGKAIGFWHVEWNSDHVLLASIQVQPDQQNRGIGTRLIRGLLDDARDRGLPIRLQVLLGNRAEHLYTRLGFREASRSNTHVQMVWRAAA